MAAFGDEWYHSPAAERRQLSGGRDHMRAGGINWLAALAAAAGFYAVGFIIYGVLIDPDMWMAAEGLTAAEIEATGASRMPFSLLMPLTTAFGMAVLFKWGNVQ